jgi:hypothetical protein
VLESDKHVAVPFMPKQKDVFLDFGISFDCDLFRFICVTGR